MQSVLHSRFKASCVLLALLLGGAGVGAGERVGQKTLPYQVLVTRVFTLNAILLICAFKAQQA
eukprot:1430766-Amphidinium_carterae.2